MNPTTARIAVVAGSVLLVYIVHLVCGLLLPGVALPPIDAAAGYGLGFAARHFWPSAPPKA
jgi:hypothetical protein